MYYWKRLYSDDIINTAEHIYVERYDHDSHEEFGLGMGFGAIDKVNCSIYILSQYILLPFDWCSNSHRCGHMVSNQINWLVCFYCGSSNLAINDLHRFDMTESYKCFTTPQYIWKPCRDHSLYAPSQPKPALYCYTDSDWLQAYIE